MPGRLRVAARSDLLRDMRRKMASSVSFRPTTTSMMDATLACCAAMGGGVGALGAGASAVPLGVAEASARESEALAMGSEESETRHLRSAAPPRKPHTTRQAANSLIREGFFRVPKMLRGTINSLAKWRLGYLSPPMGSIIATCGIATSS